MNTFVVMGKKTSQISPTNKLEEFIPKVVKLKVVLLEVKFLKV